MGATFKVAPGSTRATSGKIAGAWLGPELAPACSLLTSFAARPVTHSGLQTTVKVRIPAQPCVLAGRIYPWWNSPAGTAAAAAAALRDAEVIRLQAYSWRV